MTKWVKTRETNAKFFAVCERFGVAEVLGMKGLPFFDALMDEVFFPPVVKSAFDTMQKFFENLEEGLKTWDPEELLTLDKALATGGLETASQSDKRKVRLWLMENNLLVHNPNKGESWTVRIGHQKPQEKVHENETAEG